jgi:hypothetical protein
MSRKRYVVTATDEQAIRWSDAAHGLTCRTVEQYLARAGDLVSTYYSKMLRRAWRNTERLERKRKEKAE